jgi:hypothetical protein
MCLLWKRDIFIEKINRDISDDTTTSNNIVNAIPFGQLLHSILPSLSSNMPAVHERQTPKEEPYLPAAHLTGSDAAETNLKPNPTVLHVV